MKQPDALDALDELVRRDPKPLPADHTQFMVTAPRAQSSAEIVEREKDYLESRRLGSGINWPIPFHREDGMILPLSKDEIADLESTYKITLDEYLELMKWSPDHER